MIRRIFACAVPAVMLAMPALAQEVPQQSPPAYSTDADPSPEVSPGIYGKMSSAVTSKFKLSIGGFVKLDYIYNSTNLGSANTIGTVATLQPNGIPKSSSPAGHQHQSLFSARQSRIWFKAEGPTFLGARTGSLIESDFFGFNGSSAESSNMRIRLAYGTLDWSSTQILFGQFWDTFGPAAASTVDFGQGQTAGNPTTPRVPQVRLTQKVNVDDQNSLKFVVALQNPIQDSNAQTGSASDSWGAAPNVAGQAMFVSKAMGVAPGFWGLPMNPLTVGFFGLYGNQKLGNNAGTVDSWGYGLYTFVPLLKSKDGKSRAMTASFEGQVYRGANMYFNYATPSPVTSADGNKLEAKGYGLFGQAIFYPTQNLGITSGFGMRGAEDCASYASTKINQNFQRTNNHFFTNVTYDLNAAIRVAAEYQYVFTRYGNVNEKSINPNLTGWSDLGHANVFRFAMMYFF